MSQTETAKAVAAEERTEEARSFVRRSEGQQPDASTFRRKRSVSCWRGSAGRSTVSDLCSREGIKPHSYYAWTKEFMEAGKERLTRDMVRDATQQEVHQLKRENVELKQLVAELSLEGYRLKKRPYRLPTTTPVPEDERCREDGGTCQGGFVLRSPKTQGPR